MLLLILLILATNLWSEDVVVERSGITGIRIKTGQSILVTASNRKWLITTISQAASPDKIQYHYTEILDGVVVSESADGNPANGEFIQVGTSLLLGWSAADAAGKSGYIYPARFLKGISYPANMRIGLFDESFGRGESLRDLLIENHSKVTFVWPRPQSGQAPTDHVAPNPSTTP